MSRPSDDVDRVCGRCGVPAGRLDYFCHVCTARLPDPAHHPAAGTRPSAGGSAPDGRRLLLTVLAVVVVVGGLIAAAVVAVVRLDPFAPDPARPAEVVRSYYEAAMDDDCVAAVDLETVEFGSRTRCEQNAALLAGADASDLEVEDELVLADRASVSVRISPVRGTSWRCTLDLLLDEVWLIRDAVCQAPAPAS